MALTESTMIMGLGTSAPEFSLPDVTTGKTYGPSSFTGKPALLVMFICRHCPFVKHVEQQLSALGRDYTKQDVAIVAISSNDAENYPEDAPGSLKQQAAAAGFTFPYLYDQTQDVARRYGAACTPDFFLFDKERKLAYRGQLDGSRPGNSIANDGRDLRGALDAVLAGKPVNPEQRPSIGCNIKWKAR